MDDTVDIELKKHFVRQQACFSPLTSDENAGLAALFHEKRFKPGDTIVTEGDPVDSVYLIIEGEADVRHVTVKEGVLHIQSLATLGPDKAIGLNETGFYSLSGIRTATVVALTDMLTLRLSMPEFHGFALTYSHVSEIMRRNAEPFMKSVKS